MLFPLQIINHENTNALTYMPLDFAEQTPEDVPEVGNVLDVVYSRQDLASLMLVLKLNSLTTATNAIDATVVDRLDHDLRFNTIYMIQSQATYFSYSDQESALAAPLFTLFTIVIFSETTDTLCLNDGRSTQPKPSRLARVRRWVIVTTVGGAKRYVVRLATSTVCGAFLPGSEYLVALLGFEEVALFASQYTTLISPFLLSVRGILTATKDTADISPISTRDAVESSQVAPVRPPRADNFPLITPPTFPHFSHSPSYPYALHRAARRAVHVVNIARAGITLLTPYTPSYQWALRDSALYAVCDRAMRSRPRYRPLSEAELLFHSTVARRQSMAASFKRPQPPLAPASTPLSPEEVERRYPFLHKAEVEMSDSWDEF